MKTCALIVFLSLLLFSCGTKPNATQLCNPNAEYVDSILHKPINLYTINNIEEAISCSKELNKPILTMFTGHHCIGDKWALWKVFSNEEVNRIVSSNYIFVTLYVDDRTKLDQSYTVDYNGYEKVLESVGHVNTNRERIKYKRNTQPVYTITDFNDVDMVEHITYKDIGDNYEGFITFLDKGLEKFNKQHN